MLDGANNQTRQLPALLVASNEDRRVVWESSAIVEASAVKHGAVRNLVVRVAYTRPAVHAWSILWFLPGSE